jgi:hypothetical protein
MRKEKLSIVVVIIIVFSSCAPLQRISKHDFDSGYFKLKTPGEEPSKIYVDLKEDSISVHNVTGKGKLRTPDTAPAGGIKIGSIRPGSYLSGSTFVKSSLDFDLSTVVLKYRPPVSGVQNQLSYNVNTLFYLGFRRDYYIIKTNSNPLKKYESNILQIGFDAGFFAGFGITPVNPTMTDFKIVQEYDGFFFQKGIAAFFTIDRMSVGISLGFDNLLDDNSHKWIYNQKPWIGIILGIANF